MTVTFSKTSSWVSGWRGKQNVTDVLLDGQKVGEIKGDESASMAKVMTYLVHIGDRRVHTDSLKQAKAKAKEMLS